MKWSFEQGPYRRTGTILIFSVQKKLMLVLTEHHLHQVAIILGLHQSMTERYIYDCQ